MITKELRGLIEEAVTLLSRTNKNEYVELAIALTETLDQYPEPKFSIGDIVICDDFEDKNENLPWKIEEMYLTKAGEWRYWGNDYWTNIWCSECDLKLWETKNDPSN